MPWIQRSTRLGPDEVGEVRVLPIKAFINPQIRLSPVYLSIRRTCFVADSCRKRTQVAHETIMTLKTHA